MKLSKIFKNSINITSFIFLGLLTTAYSANVLFFHTLVTASHRISIWPLAEKLADSGHNVTYIFPISKRPGSHPRIEEITPTEMLHAVDNFVGELDINVRLNNTINEWLRDVFKKSIEFCELFYDSSNIKEWLSRPGLHYDLIMIDGGFSQCGLALVYKFRAKLVIFNPVTRTSHWDAFGIVPESSSVPEFMLHQKPVHLLNSLWSRTLNTLAPLIWRWNFVKSLRAMEEIARDKLNKLPDMPSFEEIEGETSLVLHNTYFVEDYPMSLPPMYVSYSGLLCSETERKHRKPISNVMIKMIKTMELEAFVGDDKSSGFVYISFGSAVIASAMPKWLLDEFMGTFAMFPELRFLWRWTGDMPRNAPRNVLFQPWFPQRDVLAHTKMKAFITQVGRPSVQEAICHGVPMIAFPIFADQDFNANRLAEIGAAVSLEISSLTKEILANAINEVVYGNAYKARIIELSAMFRDRPVDPLENAHFWVEYVLKYNTSLLKPLGMKQTWWQRRLLDVYAFVLFFILAILISVVFLGLLVIWCCKSVFRRYCGQDRNKDKTE